MNLYSPHLLYLLLLILPLFFWIFRRESRLKKRFERYAQPAFKELYLAGGSPFHKGLKLVISVLAFALLIFASARPQWDYQEQSLESEGLDIIFAVDISRSMEATDILPNRLLRSVLQISSFVERLKSDRIGLISFAGSATVECPLTDDYEAFRLVLNSLDTSLAQRPGTDIGRALDLAQSAFNAAAGKGVLILISDGEDLAANTSQKARQLAAKGVRIHAMGVGSETGAIIVNPLTGEEHLSRLDLPGLSQIAKEGGGEFFHITPSQAEIQLLLNRIYQQESSRGEAKSLNVYKEQYRLFVLLALALLIFESLINGRTKKRGKTP